MKKIFLSLFLLSGTAVWSIAQTSAQTYTILDRQPNPKTPQEGTEWAINFYTDALKLTTDQKTTIYGSVSKFEKEMAEATFNEEKSVAVLSHHFYLQAELQNVLTYTQYRQFQEIDLYPDGVVNPDLAPTTFK